MTIGGWSQECGAGRKVEERSFGSLRAPQDDAPLGGRRGRGVCRCLRGSQPVDAALKTVGGTFEPLKKAAADPSAVRLSRTGSG
jgi:hypothetical protein